MNYISDMSADEIARKSDFLPKDAYISPEFAKLENQRLWPRVWLMACREEELNEPGKFVTFNVAHESIIINRDDSGQIRAFHNVCPHRGRRITEGCGKTGKFYCKYHGWQWNTDGSTIAIIDGEDWPALQPAEVGLKPVRHDTWGGFVFINIDGKAKPLLEFLSPWPEMWDAFRIQDMRYRWRKVTPMNCNWKVALEAFLEGYHVQTTHRQVNNSNGGDRWRCRTSGHHSMFYNTGPTVRVGDPNPNIVLLSSLHADLFEPLEDARDRFHLFLKTVSGDLDCLYTERMVEAAERLPERVSADASNMEILGAFDGLFREIVERDGFDLSELTSEKMHALGTGWNLFPNLAILPSYDGLLIYRALPDGDDPDKCLFEIMPLERYRPGEEPAVEVEHYENWEDGNYPRIFAQDFQNVDQVQLGMKSSAFPGSLTNPLQEKVVYHLHDQIRQIISEP